MKKILDIVFILEEIGILTRISKHLFCFTGLKGLANNT